MSSYRIPKAVHGEIGGVGFKYKAGTVTPKDASEARVLEHLVSAGVASRAGKKESK